MKKPLVTTMMTLLLSLSFVFAAQATPTVVLNGKMLSFDVQPVNESGITLVPLRAIFQALGASVQWDGATQTVTATKWQTEIKLTIGQNIAYKNGTPVTLQVPGKVIKGSTMVPLRFVSESLGASVNWKDGTIEIAEAIKPLMVTNENFFDPKASTGEIRVFATVENPNENYIPYRIQYCFSAYDSSGKLVATSGKGLPGSLVSTLYLIPPHQKITLSGTIYPGNEKVSKVKLNIPSFEWKKISSNIPVLSVKNVKLISDDSSSKIIGEVTNQSTETVNAWVLATFVDSKGTPVDGDKTAIDNIGPGQTLPFEMILFGKTGSAKIEVVAYPTRLNRIQ